MSRKSVPVAYPAGAAFGGYKISGIGRENHQMTLEHYSQTKNLLVSYSTKPLGFFWKRDRGPVMFIQSDGCCDESLS
jgi:hypothetical protein